MVSVLHSVDCVDADTGGPARSVPALCRALEQKGLRIGLVTRRPKDGGAPAEMPSETRFAPTSRYLSLRAFDRALDEEAEHLAPDLLHDHGIWLPCNHAAARVARRRSLPRVVSPRGMLDAWALGSHGFRKRVAWRAYQREDLAAAALLHATSEAEAEGFRRLGLPQPVAVIPNGVVVPEVARRTSRAEGRTVLYLSRIHPKKGLLDLVHAWSRVRAPDWQLWIAGNGSGRYASRVRRAVRDSGLEDRVRFLGAVEGARKAEVLARADLFVLPTYSENFGLAVAEALAAGMPVITTRAAPWSVLQEEKCGWWVEVGAASLAAALADACTSDATTLARMGERGRALVVRDFSWPTIAARLEAVYRWLLGGGDPPADVRRVESAA